MEVQLAAIIAKHTLFRWSMKLAPVVAVGCLSLAADVIARLVADRRRRIDELKKQSQMSKEKPKVKNVCSLEKKMRELEYNLKNLEEKKDKNGEDKETIVVLKEKLTSCQGEIREERSKMEAMENTQKEEKVTIQKLQKEIQILKKYATDKDYLEALQHDFARKQFMSTHNDMKKAISTLNPEKYEIQEDKIDLKDRIGKGAFGDVYSALLEYNDENHMVAIKMPDITIPRKRVKSFERELRAVDIRHENVIHLIGYTFFMRNMRVGIVMELLEGGSLWDVIHQGIVTVTPAMKERFATQMLKGLAFLHSKGVIHRDIKSKNLLLNKDLSVLKISDFGLAKYRDESSNSTSCHGHPTFVGTPKYAAPEVLNGQAESSKFEEGSKSDVYSCAIVLAEVYGEDEPFYCLALEGLKEEVVEKNERPRDLLDDCPSSVVDVIETAWHREPQHRPTAEEFLLNLVEAYRGVSL